MFAILALPSIVQWLLAQHRQETMPRAVNAVRPAVYRCTQGMVCVYCDGHTPLVTCKLDNNMLQARPGVATPSQRRNAIRLLELSLYKHRTGMECLGYYLNIQFILLTQHSIMDMIDKSHLYGNVSTNPTCLQIVMCTHRSRQLIVCTK